MCGAEPSHLLRHLSSNRWGSLVLRQHEGPLCRSERREDDGGCGGCGGGGHGSLRRGVGVNLSRRVSASLSVGVTGLGLRLFGACPERGDTTASVAIGWPVGADP